MITLFPIGFDDELDFSIFGRHWERMPFISSRSYLFNTFGTENLVPSVGFSTRLDYLYKNTISECNESVDVFINNHSLLPYFAVFLSSDKVADIRRAMREGPGNGILTRLGAVASRVKWPRYLRLCPECRDLDRSTKGCCYWRRVHQLPGVVLCPIHGVPLISTIVRFNDRQMRHAYVSAEQALYSSSEVLNTFSPDEAYRDILLSIARSSAWLLQQSCWVPGIEAIHDRYSVLLRKHGLTDRADRIHVRELQQFFEKSIPRGILEILGCNYEAASDDNWLLKIVRKPRRSMHPLYHLVVMQTLGLSAEQFFQVETQSKPFGLGPWQCKNTVCSQYNEYVIYNCTVTYSRYTDYRPTGSFACPQCQFTFAITKAQSDVLTNMERIRIVDVGPVWRNELSSLWADPSISLRELARRLGVDPNTIRSYALQLELPFPRPGGYAPKLESKRDVEQNPTRSSNTVGLLNNAQNASRISEVEQNGRRQRSVATRDIWKERDRHVAKLICIGVRKMKQLPGRPILLSISSIGQFIGHRSLLQKHLNKLPISQKILSKLVDTRERWALRRVAYVVKLHQEECKPLTRWALIKEAGIERLIHDATIVEAINQALILFNHNLTTLGDE